MDSPAVLALVVKAKAGDRGAFGELYALYSGRLYRFIKIKVPETSTAEELLQETFLKSWQALPKLKLENLNFNAWLYKIARNLVNDHYRKVYRRPQLEDIDQHYDLASPADTATEVALALELERIRQARPRLKAEYNQVLELRFVQGFSVAETSQIIGKTKVAVRILQHRALKKLYSLLTESYETNQVSIT